MGERVQVQTLGGGLKRSNNGIFLQFEFRFRNKLGRILDLQNFRITHLLNGKFYCDL